MRRPRAFLLALSAVAAVFSTAAAMAGSAEVAALHAIFDREWERGLRENPLRATYLGDARYNRLWPDRSPEALEASHAGDVAALAALEAIPRAALPPAEQLNYDLFRRSYRDRVELHAFKPDLYAINQKGGVQLASEITEQLRLASAGDYDDLVARMSAFGRYVDQDIALLETGIRERRVPPRVIVARVPAQVRQQLVANPEDSPWYKPFRSMPTSIAPEEQRRLRAGARRAIAEVILPAYRRLDAFVADRYLPACRDSVGIADTPDGQAWYRRLAQHHTTTTLTPDEIHEIGLAEVKRIRGEMDRVIEQVGFKGTFAEFVQYLRTDPRFYYHDPQELLSAYAVMAKRIDPLLPQLFGKLPRTPYGVRPIPDSSAPDTTTAYYMPPSADGRRPGYYYVNLYKPGSRPKYEIPVLTVHEAVPGHHLQIALSYEMGDLPAFRRQSQYTAFVEGWALYSESLGDEIGLYADPYDKFGQLTYDMWRAVRLVVDTGMHYKGWTRDQAIQFFKDNAAKTELDIVNEVDRYIAWPGQALAYKIGQMRIRALRREAEQALGPRFDVRAFHDTVLEQGAVPLDILEAHVRAWIAAQVGRPAAGS